MNLDTEINRLIDIMPASGRMYCKIVSAPVQSSVLTVELPLPWQQTRPIAINFEQWRNLSRPERDLLLLRTVCWLTGVTWFKPHLSQAVVVGGAIAAVVELFQADAVGVVAAGGAAALAGLQIWRSHRSVQRELDADEAAIQVAVRRGYTADEAARSLLAGIESVARLELRTGLNFTELVRCQNLKAIAGLSTVTVPDSIRQEN